MSLLTHKKILITGVVSNISIAYGIAKKMHEHGAELAFTYYGERFKERIEKIAQDFGSNLVFPCDVSNDADLATTYEQLSKHWPSMHGIIHSVGFAPTGQLDGKYIDCVTRDGFKIAHDVSSYSFSALAKTFLPLMQQHGGTLLTLTYLGSQRAVVNYNVMGLAKASLEASVKYLAQDLGPYNIRVNAISAGPIRTLAASGIKDFRQILKRSEEITPIRRNVTQEDVGNVATFLCSDMASAITGDTIYVDCGYHAIDPLMLGA